MFATKSKAKKCHTQDESSGKMSNDLGWLYPEFEKRWKKMTTRRVVEDMREGVSDFV